MQNTSLKAQYSTSLKTALDAVLGPRYETYTTRERCEAYASQPRMDQ